MELLKECPFEFDKEKKLGHMRCDYDGGQDIRPYKTWHGRSDIEEICDILGIDLEELDEAINFVCNDCCPTYTKFKKYVGYLENPYDHVNYFFQHKNIDVWVRMIPAKSDYNMYINLYHR